MPSGSFTASDFEVFTVSGFQPRMEAIRGRIRPRLGPVLRRVRGLAWFKNEHDEESAGMLADLDVEGFARLADELLRGRGGQVVLGRVVPATEASRWKDADYHAAALETFRALAPLYRLH